MTRTRTSRRPPVSKSAHLSQPREFVCPFACLIFPSLFCGESPGANRGFRLSSEQTALSPFRRTAFSYPPKLRIASLLLLSESDPLSLGSDSGRGCDYCIGVPPPNRTRCRWAPIRDAAVIIVSAFLRQTGPAVAGLRFGFRERVRSYTPHSSLFAPLHSRGAKIIIRYFNFILHFSAAWNII